MQQTSKYKLNLIETSDRFSPDPLNENAEKLETQLAAETQARTAADTAEARARTDADAAEAKTRTDAIAAEAKTRADADTAETNARKAAITAEAKARTDAIAAEAKTRADADTAETSARKAAITAEAKARTDAIAAEAKTRADADTAETNARKAADTALDKRVKVLEARRVVWGVYTGNGASDRTISLGFTPGMVIVFVCDSTYQCSTMATADFTPLHLAITTGGFKVGPIAYRMDCNTNGQKYTYLATI